MEKRIAHHGRGSTVRTSKDRTVHKPSRARGGDGKSAQVGPELRRVMVAEAAYYRAEKRGFAPGQETADWLAAEAEIAALLDRMMSPQ